MPPSLPARILRSAPVVGALRSLLPAAIALFALLAVLPRTGLYRTVTPLSGSMEPTFAAGDLLVLRPEPLSALRVGQVITYAIPVDDHHVETHRVVRLLRGGAHPVVQTRGDANPVADPWTARLQTGPAWVLDRVVPHGGLPLLWLAAPWLRAGFMVALSVLVLVLGLARIWRPSDRPAPVHVLAVRRSKDDDAVVAA
ncbi:MAG TPA: signal peptidase I [Gaiellaceae bacterium]|nr:signal peptidase I [Gaiellaceae bacterium]